MPGKKASMLDREEYVVGSIVKKLAKPLANLFEDSSEKAIENKMKAVHKAVEEAPAGTKRSDTFKKVAEKEDITVQDVKDIEKVFAYRAGGGGGDESILGETVQTLRAMTKKPTTGQQFSEELGGTATTKAARKAKGKAVLKTSLLGAAGSTATGVGGYLAGLSAEQKAKVKENKTTTVTDITSGTMDSAFSKASKNPTKYVFMKAGQPHFKYKGQAVPFALATEEENVVLDMMPRTKKNQGGKRFPDLTGDGKVTQADVLKGRGVFAEGSKADKDLERYRQELISRTEMPSISPTEDEELIIRERVAALKKLSLEELQEMKIMEEQRQMDLKMRKAAQRVNKQEGGSMLVPPEMEDMPVDTYTPEEQANAEATQLPDSEMEDNYMDFVLDESLQADEQEYLMNALEADPKLNSIIDKVIMTASEFSGAGEVEGPGTGVSDSIPARLSDGEFVITEKATDEIGADNLQRMMDDAERMSDGGEARYGLQMGGMLANPMAMKQEDPELMDDPMQQTEEEINKSMMQANRIPSLMGAYR